MKDLCQRSPHAECSTIQRLAPTLQAVSIDLLEPNIYPITTSDPQGKEKRNIPFQHKHPPSSPTPHASPSPPPGPPPPSQKSHQPAAQSPTDAPPRAWSVPWPPVPVPPGPISPTPNPDSKSPRREATGAENATARAQASDAGSGPRREQWRGGPDRWHSLRGGR